MIEPGFDCQRLISVEVYTPSGNWSSFPAHKHDERLLNDDGSVQEARLEETYFYKIEKPQGYAIQQVYTSDRELDEMAYERTNDVVMVPRGTIRSWPGMDTTVTISTSSPAATNPWPTPMILTMPGSTTHGLGKIHEFLWSLPR